MRCRKIVVLISRHNARFPKRLFRLKERRFIFSFRALVNIEYECKKIFNIIREVFIVIARNSR